MRPIGGVETRITKAAIALTTKSTDDLRRLLKEKPDAITRKAVKRVLSYREAR